MKEYLLHNGLRQMSGRSRLGQHFTWIGSIYHGKYIAGMIWYDLDKVVLSCLEMFRQAVLSWYDLV